MDSPVDLPLGKFTENGGLHKGQKRVAFTDENGIDEPEEEDEEVDINIDEGFLTDSSGNTVDIPLVE